LIESACKPGVAQALPGVRQLKILPCPVPEQLDMLGMGDAGQWCEHCARQVSNASGLEPEQFEELIVRAATSRVCVRLELESRRPKLRSGVAASVLVLALAGCATATTIEPIEPIWSESARYASAFVDSEPLESIAEDSEITGFIIGEDGEALANATVTLYRDGGELTGSAETTTSELGMYGFVGVAPGDYSIGVITEQGVAGVNVAVPKQTRVRVSVRGPYQPAATLIAGYMEVIERKGGFESAGPHLIDDQVKLP
jgi:hypothetical protein